MKRIRHIGLIILACAAIFGCGKSVPKESDVDLIRDHLTNDVVGYSRTISIEQYIFGNLTNYEKDWNDTNDFDGYLATVEFVNSVGGIERTNLPYRMFDLNSTNYDGSVEHKRAAILDSVIMAEREAAQYRAFINAIDGQTNSP